MSILTSICNPNFELKKCKSLCSNNARMHVEGQEILY